MSAPSGPGAGRRSGRERIGVAVGLIALLYLVNGVFSGDFSGFQRFFADARTQVFTVVFLAVLLEGFPFLLLGALVSGLIEVAVPPSVIERRFPRRPVPAVAAGALLGCLFPVCSCGNIPVMRRLLRKGVPLGGAIAYLLAAPIVNPVTIASTLLAFAGSFGVAAGRVLLALGVAAAGGLLFGRRADPLLPETGGAACCAGHAGEPPILRVLRHAEHDFLLTGRYLIPGAVAAALFQTFVSRQALAEVAGSGIASAVFMQAAAMGFCLCSFADAFVAASFTAVPSWAKIVFLVAGPMVNAALITLYFGTFRRPFAIRFTAAVAGTILVAALVGGAIGGTR